MQYRTLFFSAYVWFLIVFVFVCHSLIMVPLRLIIKDHAALDYALAKWFLKMMLRFSGLRYSLKGLEHIPKEAPFILVCNHQSLLDIAVLMVGLPIRFFFFAKQELRKVPLLGANMAHEGHFFVDRSNPHKASEQLAAVKAALVGGGVVLVFPEGTRSFTEELGEFKRGAFVLAAQTGLPVIPIYLNGTNRVLRKKSLVIHRGSVSVSIGEPIPYTKATQKSEEKPLTIALAEQCREAILKLKAAG
ncbi:MAG: lysophospholipid acyltransferase family protein [Candidatus Margulisiibacteriota bacterium]